MTPVHQWARSLALAAAVALTAGLSFSGVVAAHSGLGAARPAPGSTVGGEITAIELRYAASVTDPAGSVTAPDGTVVDSTVTQDGALSVTIELSVPLTAPGEYTVRHATTSVADGDRVEAAYLFTYDPTAPPPQLEILDGTTHGGRSPWVWAILVVGVLVIVVLAVRLIRAAHRLRSTA